MPQIYVKEFNNEEIGMGFSSQSGKVVGTALDIGEITENKYSTGAQVLSEITIVNSHEDFMNKLGMSFEAQGRYSAFSSSLKAEFSEQSSYNSTSTFLIARCIVRNSFIRGRNFRVKPEAEALLKSNRFNEFYTAFGDSFVRGLQTGGEFYCIIRITSMDIRTQTELAEKLKSEFGKLIAEGGFKLAFNQANSNSSTKSEFTATMYQRGGKGVQITPVNEISEALYRFKHFPEFALENPVGYETEIASYNTIPLPLPTHEELENFNLALRDAREKKLYYLQKRNDLQFALNNPDFFQGLPKSETIQEAINTYTRLSAAAMEYGVKLSIGEIKPPKLFIPPLKEPELINLQRVKLPEIVTVPNVVGMDTKEAIHVLREKGLDPGIYPIYPPILHGPSINRVIKQDPEADNRVQVGSSVKLYTRIQFFGRRHETFNDTLWKQPFELYHATCSQIPHYEHRSSYYPYYYYPYYYYPRFVDIHSHVHYFPDRTAVYPYSYSIPYPYFILGTSY
ncbi:PASTA domain-containing protein [Bacillus sp. AR18-7]|uniref:PASTA domain-containing protein n=1 Tax=Bacillus sp. AR18-7 TaxID=2217821 RepID=UPI0011CC2D2E|nr:PASTA domain-containing protein [Bacillus sp. AR18-7]TXR64525.1 PASTA domain-containing protein [Bacillus sp. AR18-7]